MAVTGIQYGTVADCSEHRNELPGSIKGEEFGDHPSNYRLLKPDFATLI